ncbi:hypothetical protein EI555_012015, partial [Monodon monoceros]
EPREDRKFTQPCNPLLRVPPKGPNHSRPARSAGVVGSGPGRQRPGLPEPWPLPPARPPGRRPGHRGNAEKEGGARGLTGDRSRLSPGSADPRPLLPLGPAPAPRPSLTPTVRRLLHLLLLLLPPLGRGSCSGSARRRRRRPRERRRRRLQNAHARSTQAPPPSSAPPLRVSVGEVSAPPSPRLSGVRLKGPRWKAVEELRTQRKERGVAALPCA